MVWRTSFPDDFQAFKEVGESIVTPLAQGENLHTLFESAFKTGALGFPQPYASNIGGITGWLKLAKMSQNNSLKICSHGMHELHVSLLSSVENSGYLEIHSFPIDKYTLEPVKINNSLFMPPTSNGNGVSFDLEKLCN